EARRQSRVSDERGALEAFAVGVERVARQIKADRGEFVLQALNRRPVGDQRQRRPRRKARVDAGEEALLAARALLGCEARLPQEKLRCGEGLRPVRVEAV